MFCMVHVVHPESAKRRIESDVALGSDEVNRWLESATTLLVKFMEERFPAVAYTSGEQNQSNM